jgi:hypothetical protein
MRVRFVAAGAAALAGATLGFAAPALAQHPINNTDWRQADRTDHEQEKADSARPLFAFELRFGTYNPQVDSEFANPKGAPCTANGAPAGSTGPCYQANPSKRPFAQVFGTGAQFYFGLEADFQPLHIPYFGSLGAAFGWGFSEANANATFTAGPHVGQPSAETTSFTVMPMYLSAVFRLDEPLYHWNFPLVPYAKFGLGAGIWNAGNSSGTEYAYTDPRTPGLVYPVSANGISWGEHFAIGGALSLNFIDQAAVSRSRELGGARDFYLFAEYMDLILNGIGAKPQMHVGSESFVAGLAIDF